MAHAYFDRLYFFLSLLAGKFNHFQTDVIEMQSSK